jgi:hypothetical protein
MWRKACPPLTGVLAVALILVAWRLKTVETELDRVRDELAGTWTAGPARGSTETPAASDAASAAGPGESPDVAGDSPDISTEWEQAVPPMDS